MNEEIRVPKMGMDTTEVIVTRWLVKVGDSVEIGTPLVELESEKTILVLDSQVGGRIVSIAHLDGSVVPVGEPLGTIEAI